MSLSCQCKSNVNDPFREIRLPVEICRESCEHNKLGPPCLHFARSDAPAAKYLQLKIAKQGKGPI